MDRVIAVIGAPSSLGIRPYDDGEARHISEAPQVLRQRNLVPRLGALDFGDVLPPPYRDFVRPPARARNEREIVKYSRALAERVATAAGHGRFAVVAGGDCSIVLGCLLGAHRTAGDPIGLVYVDAHADLASPEESATGSVSGMSLRLALGRERTPLAHLGGAYPLVDERHVALIGHRPAVRAGAMSLDFGSTLDVRPERPDRCAIQDVAVKALARAAAPGTHGFWIHLDLDVLDPTVMPAVDSPEAGGLLPNQLTELLGPLVRHRRAIGLDFSIYDPALDADRSCARLIVGLLEELLGGSTCCNAVTNR